MQRDVILGASSSLSCTHTHAHTQTHTHKYTPTYTHAHAHNTHTHTVRATTTCTRRFVTPGWSALYVHDRTAAAASLPTLAAAATEASAGPAADSSTSAVTSAAAIDWRLVHLLLSQTVKSAAQDCDVACACLISWSLKSSLSLSLSLFLSLLCIIYICVRFHYFMFGFEIHAQSWGIKCTCFRYIHRQSILHRILSHIWFQAEVLVSHLYIGPGIGVRSVIQFRWRFLSIALIGFWHSCLKEIHSWSTSYI